MLNTTDKIIKHKTGLLNLAEELGNVSKACQAMGYSRDTFYRYKSAVEDGGKPMYPKFRIHFGPVSGQQVSHHPICATKTYLA